MEYKINNTLRKTLVFMVGLLLASITGIYFSFFGGTSPVSLIPKTLEVRIICDKDTYLSSHVLNADRNQGYLGIMFVPVTRGNSKLECSEVSIQSVDIDLSQAYISNWNSFTAKRPKKTVDHEFGKISDNHISFNNQELVNLRAFGLVIPTNKLVANTDAGVWTTAISMSTTYESSKPPEVISPNEFAVLIDPTLVITEINPPLSRGVRSGLVDVENFSTLFENKTFHPQELDHRSGSLQLKENREIENTVNRINFFLKLRDPNYNSRKNILLLIFSTLFGISISGLIETFLALSFSRNVQPTKTPPADNRDGDGFD
jgi:hypothetical protein